MYDHIPYSGVLHDVAPGDPWQPEPAALYNAVNELLRQEHAPSQAPPLPQWISECTLYVCNSSDR